MAEGVEDPDTLAILRTLECNLAQGYFIGQPVGAEEILSILESSSSVQAVAQA